MTIQGLSRRQFLRLSAMTGGAAILTACGAESVAPAATAVPPTVAPPTAVPNTGSVIIGDVLDHALKSDDWLGSFGFVKFRLQEGIVDGNSVYFIRTDASDADYASEHGMVNVPLLANGKDFAASLYIFDNDHLPVLSTSPDDEAFISLFHVKNVTVNGDGLTFASAADVEAAAASGNVSIEETNVMVNHPVVKWAGGELSVDEDKAEYLGTGQLLEPVNIDEMTVTFKLHECFPSSRYIVTDTSAAPMAPMMSISAAPPSQQMVDADGTDEIWVFANGIEGSGVMGFQPAIFDNQAGSPEWSPFWNHFTLKWNDGVEPRVLRDSRDARAALEAGDVELFNGTPNSHPNGFVVNCPVPVLATNTFEA